MVEDSGLVRRQGRYTYLTPAVVTTGKLFSLTDSGNVTLNTECPLPFLEYLSR